VRRPPEPPSGWRYGPSWVAAFAIELAEKLRIGADNLAGADPTSLTRGGSVEVFSSQDAAVARQKYIEQIAKAAPVLANEYDYVYGPVLVRVTGKLTPAQAAGYGRALQI
jgi:hypothetical protein